MKSTLLPALTPAAPGLRAGSGPPLKLLRTIPLPGVSGRIDHLALDLADHRLFVAALGNDTVEVVDLMRGQVVRSITGLAEPQGLAYVPASGRLDVANGENGTVRVFDATTSKLPSTRTTSSMMRRAAGSKPRAARDTST